MSKKNIRQSAGMCQYLGLHTDDAHSTWTNVGTDDRRNIADQGRKLGNKAQFLRQCRSGFGSGSVGNAEAFQRPPRMCISQHAIQGFGARAYAGELLYHPVDNLE